MKIARVVLTALALLVILSTAAAARLDAGDGYTLVWKATTDFPCEDQPLVCWASVENGSNDLLFNIKKQRCDLGEWVGPVSWRPGWIKLCIQEWLIYTNKLPTASEADFCRAMLQR